MKKSPSRDTVPISDGRGGSVPDPNQDQDPPDPRVFWPPGSGSTSQRY
jgi:hypothetical protein